MSHEETLRDLRRRRDAIVNKQAEAKARKESLQREIADLQKEAKELGVTDIKKLPDIIKEEEKKLKDMESKLSKEFELLETEVRQYEEASSE